MQIVYVGLVVVILLQMLLFLKRSKANADSEQTLAHVLSLPELIKEKLTNSLLENNQRLLTEFSQLDSQMHKLFSECRIAILNHSNTHVGILADKLGDFSRNTTENVTEGLTKVDKNISVCLNLVVEKLHDSTMNLSNRFTDLNRELTLSFTNFKTEMLRQEQSLNNNLLEKFNTLNSEVKENFSGFTANILKHETDFNTTIIERFNGFSSELKSSLAVEINRLVETLRIELDRLNIKVESRLKEGFSHTNQTFSNILQRLTKIDEAQKKIDELSTEIISLQDVLTDKKTRGIFGEVHLQQILVAAFGENNHRLYNIQHKLANGNIADAVLLTPEPLGKIVIDSKFPLENYKRMVDNTSSAEEREQAKREFEVNVKKHIDDISSKYILVNETSKQAIMFIPAEAIFAHLHAYHDKVLEYAYKKCIWLASPTTLMAVLTTVQVVVKNMEQAKHAKTIQENLYVLSEEFKRYRERWDNLSKHIDTVAKDIKEINVTTGKIGSRFESIAKVELLDSVN